MNDTQRNNFLRGGIVTAILLTMFHFHGVSVFEELNGRSLFLWMVRAWSSVAGTAVDYSHGYIVPLVSLFLVWRKRKVLADTRQYVDGRGLLVVIAALGMHWVGLRTQLAQLSVVSLIILLWAIPFYLFGGKVARLTLFPCVYLFFCLPLNFIEELSFPLRLFGAAVSAVVLNGLGIEVTRSGTAIFVSANGGFGIDVADACSGLKSLMALASLSAAYAYITQRTHLGKWLLFASSVPFAVLGNIIRIVTIALVGSFFGQRTALQFYHDFSGYVVFVVVILLLVAFGNLLNGRCRGVVRGDTVGVNVPQVGAAGSRAFSVVVVLLLSAWVLFGSTTTVSLATETGVRTELPNTLGNMVAHRVSFCHNEQCQRSWSMDDVTRSGVCPSCGSRLGDISLGEKRQLPLDTTISRRRYEDGSGRQVHVTVVVSGLSRSSIHRPQWCLRAQGHIILRSEVVRISGSKEHKPFEVMVLETEQANQGNIGRKTGPNGLFAYWFVDGDSKTPYHCVRILFTARDRLFRAQVRRWAYVSVMLFNGDRPVEEQKKDLAAFISLLHTRIATEQ